MIHTFLDLCSGIGGGRLGLEQLGLKCVGYSDTSRLAKKTYELMHETSGETYYCNYQTDIIFIQHKGEEKNA